MSTGIDRDLAVQLITKATQTANLVASINDTLYVPHITTQPTDQTGAVGDTITFSLVANNVASYQWQFRPLSQWQNSSSSGYNTNSLSVEVNAQRYTYDYRCRITGKDGSIIYSDIVHILEPET